MLLMSVNPVLPRPPPWPTADWGPEIIGLSSFIAVCPNSLLSRYSLSYTAPNRLQEGSTIRAAILILLTTMTATIAQDAKTLAQRGYVLFKHVLAGDEGKLPEAIRLMEESVVVDDSYAPNEYNLARAYFFDGITFNKSESFAKAEKAFARVLELDSTRTDAMAFHGSILAHMSAGRDMALFMSGAQEMKTALQRTPDDLTVRIVLAFAALEMPPQARTTMGVTNLLGDLRFIGKALEAMSSDFAPHASVVMNAYIGEGLMIIGDKEQARASFEQALKVPQPMDDGERAPVSGSNRRSPVE
jgi:tetratricopeptide (TPR) repeat protein